jgi:prepilin-type N-terminal cleavage/methylation domain-containing protein
MALCHPRRPRPASRGGFTLVEIVVAMLLVTIMATSLATYTGYLARQRMEAKQQAVAFVAAQEAIDVVRSKAFSTIPTGTSTTTSTIGRVPLTVTTLVELSTTRMKLITITVQNAQGKRLQYFITTVFKEIP